MVDRLPQAPGIRFRPEFFLTEVNLDLARAAGVDYIDESMGDAAANEYARRLKVVVDRELSVTSAQTYPRSSFDVGGPGAEFDLVTLAIQATTAVGAYVIWKEVAADLRKGVTLLRRLSRSHVLVDESAAILAAVDTVAEPGTFADIAVRFVAPVHRPDSEYFVASVGYFVGLEQDGRVTVVAINEDGEAIGRGDLAGIDPRLLGL